MIDRLKYNYWGHRSVIFHSVDIRKQKDKFSILRDKPKRDQFTSDMNNLIQNLDFKIIASGIHKVDHMKQYTYPVSPYSLTLEFIMERLYFYFRGTSESCNLIAEARGEKENKDLHAVFERLMTQGNRNITPDEFQRHIRDLKFYPKGVNENGNQIADLVAYPIARKIFSRISNYEPYNIIKQKFYSRSDGNFWGYGLKAFPSTTNYRVQQDPA
jgi:hypothetical protein